MSGSPKWSRYEVSSAVRAEIAQEVEMDMAEARRVTTEYRERLLRELRQRRAAAPAQTRAATPAGSAARPTGSTRRPSLPAAQAVQAAAKLSPAVQAPVVASSRSAVSGAPAVQAASQASTTKRAPGVASSRSVGSVAPAVQAAPEAFTAGQAPVVAPSRSVGSLAPAVQAPGVASSRSAVSGVAAVAHCVSGVEEGVRVLGADSAGLVGCAIGVAPAGQTASVAIEEGIRSLSALGALGSAGVAVGSAAGVEDRWQCVVDELHATVLSRASEDLVARHCGHEVVELGEAIARVQECAPSADVVAETVSIGTRLAELDAAAREREEARRIRDYVAQGILSVLGSMGFTVTQPLSTECSDDPSESVSFCAARPGRGAIAVSVPLSGEVWYNVGGGYVARAGRSAEGAVVRSCDEAEETIVEMQRAVAQHFAVHLDEPMWEGKQVKPRERTAVDTPTDSHGHQQGGNGR